MKTLENYRDELKQGVVDFEKLVDAGMSVCIMDGMYLFLDEIQRLSVQAKCLLDTMYDDVHATRPEEEPEYNREG